MIHYHQGLAFLFEAKQHSFRIHSGLHKFQRDPAFDGFCLASDPDFAHSTFANLFHQHIAVGDFRVGC